MASATSSQSKVKVTEKQGRASTKTTEKYYKTDVTTLADGSVKRETYRTDSKGNNAVKISEVTADKNGKITNDTTLSTATEGEKKALQNPDSQLRSSIRQQTKQAGEAALANEEQAAAGGLTEVGKKNVDVVGGGSGNNANSPDTAGTQQSPTATKEPGSGLSNVQQRTDYAQVIRYPEDIDTNTQDFLKLQMVEYKPRGVTPSEGSIGITPRSNSQGGRSILSSIYLPIPGGISDQNNVGWGDDKLDPLQVAGAELVQGALEGALGDAAGNVAAGVKQQAEGVKTAVKGAVTKSITGVNALGRIEGAVLNNNLELLFSGAELRKFTFTFNFTPRSASESQSVLQIIRTLKQGMSPKKSDGFLFIKSPHTFFLGYYKGGSQRLNPFLNKFKECALTGLSVQYAPAGNYATYTDGSPTQYTVQMAFSELEPVFDDDYGDGYADVGF